MGTLKNALKDANQVDEIVTSGERPLSMNDTVWKDVFGRINAKNLDTSKDKWDFKKGYYEANKDGDPNDEYECIYITHQLNHDVDYRVNARTSLHIHWVQEQILLPEWHMEYKVIPTGGEVPSGWTPGSVIVPAIFSYDHPGAQDQITQFNYVDINGLEVSSRILWRLWRIDDGTSYTVNVKISDFDIHVPIYTLGSKDEIVR